MKWRCLKNRNMSETTFKKELLSCLPFFILHLSRYFSVSACKFWLNFQFLSGMSASFTTILIEHYEKTFKNSTDPFETNKDIVEAMLGTFQVKCFIHSTFLLRKYLQDIPPILVSVMGGFLQQMYGPKRILMVSAVPSILSWFLVALGSSSISILLMSRFIPLLSLVQLKWALIISVLGSARAWLLDSWLEMFSWFTQLQTTTSGHSKWSRWSRKSC